MVMRFSKLLSRLNFGFSRNICVFYDLYTLCSYVLLFGVIRHDDGK